MQGPGCQNQIWNVKCEMQGPGWYDKFGTWNVKLTAISISQTGHVQSASQIRHRKYRISSPDHQNQIRDVGLRAGTVVPILVMPVADRISGERVCGHQIRICKQRCVSWQVCMACYVRHVHLACDVRVWKQQPICGIHNSEFGVCNLAARM